MTWYKDGIQIHSGKSLKNVDRVFAEKTSLKITSVYKEDAGVYQCFVHVEGSNHQATAELRLGGKYTFFIRRCSHLTKNFVFLKNNTSTIHEINSYSLFEKKTADAAPNLHYTFIDQTLQPGPWVSLKCSAKGSPTPQIKWLLDGYELPQSDR